jgi:hypothetical protein
VQERVDWMNRDATQKFRYLFFVFWNDFKYILMSLRRMHMSQLCLQAQKRSAVDLLLITHSKPQTHEIFEVCASSELRNHLMFEL